MARAARYLLAGILVGLLASLAGSFIGSVAAGALRSIAPGERVCSEGAEGCLEQPQDSPNQFLARVTMTVGMAALSP